MRQNLSNLIILTLIVTIGLLGGIGSIYKNLLTKRIYNDAIIVNHLGQIRGNIQRYTKLKIANQPYKKVEKEIDNLFQKVSNNISKSNIIPDNCKTHFFAEFSRLKNIWEKIKKNESILPLSEEAWKKSNNLISHFESIHKLKFEELIKIIDLIVYASMLILTILTYIVYKKIKNGLELDVVTDKLTSLYNRLHFNEQYECLLNQYQTRKKPFSMIILDIDNFKQINDTYGHQKGDEILKKVSQIIKDSIRRADIAFRYGGEEFIVLLPDTKLNEAFKVANRIKNTISKNIQIESKPVTISGGVGEYNGIDPDKFFEAIDDALYQAKQNGKNQIISI